MRKVAEGSRGSHILGLAAHLILFSFPSQHIFVLADNLRASTTLSEIKEANTKIQQQPIVLQQNSRNLPKTVVQRRRDFPEQKWYVDNYEIDEDVHYFHHMLLADGMSISATDMPSDPPTDSPTVLAIANPTLLPTNPPTTIMPTNPPTAQPIRPPTNSPTVEETLSPTESPTDSPTIAPVAIVPTQAPAAPTFSPSRPPSPRPTPAATITPPPTRRPTPQPITIQPTPRPTSAPPPSDPPSPFPSMMPSTPCNLSEAGRAALINIFIRVVSNPADVDTPGSPQFQATNWIINDDPLYLCPQDTRLIQRYVMAVFYYSTRGDRWSQCSAPENYNNPESIEQANEMCMISVMGGQGTDAWLTPSDECSWGGLGCNDDNMVTRIEMEQNGVAGTLPFELNRLQNLRYLMLEEGILTGTLPAELGEVRTLEQIDLNFNLLQGPIPRQMYLLSNLRILDLNDNELTGTISTNISNLPRLTFFQIENNQFSGTVPVQMEALNLLEVATMDNNQLSGTMPCQRLNSTGNLQILTSDCLGAPNRPSPPLVVCDCCTQCF